MRCCFIQVHDTIEQIQIRITFLKGFCILLQYFNGWLCFLCKITIFIHHRSIVSANNSPDTKNWRLWMSATITPEITHKLFLLFLMQRMLPFPALHQQLYIIPIVKLLIPMIFIQIHLTIRQIEAIWKYTFQTSLQHGLLIWNHVPIPWRITI